MPHFLLRLVPPRASFLVDMTEEERGLMGEHAAFLSREMAAGRVLAFGPVADPKGAYGFALVEALSTASVETMTLADPAIRARCGFAYDISPILQLITAAGLKGPARNSQ